MTEAEAAVAILHAQGPEESILLIRRAEREGDSWSGHWSFPGGWRSDQDEDMLATALRELTEECGIVLTRDLLEASLPYAVAGRSVGRFVTVAPFVFRVDHPLPVRLDPGEAVEALWLDVKRLRDPAEHAPRRIPGFPEDRMFPGIELNGIPLWGFTYKLVCSWLEIS